MSRIPDVGDVVDDVFRVESELEHGNFGAIYRVHDIVEDRTLALKIQKPGPHDEQEVRKRFEREARLIYSLDHDHVVEVLYYGQTHDGLPYMAMEFLDGTDLKRLLRGGFELNRDQIKRIALETLSALDAAHRIGIVHRDLKPANIFLVDDGDRGHVKVLDFGFAKAQGDDQNRQLTQAGTLVGSPAYMAPEMVHKEDVGAHSDLYGMGLILAEMITGQKIVQIENVYDTIVFQGSDKPIELPAEVERSPFGDVIERAVRKSIRRRYDSAAEMMEELRALGRGEMDADLQSHAEIDTTPAGSGAVGERGDDAETRPRDHGMPSEKQLDRQLSGGGASSGDPKRSGSGSREHNADREPNRSVSGEPRSAASGTPDRSAGRRNSSGGMQSVGDSRGRDRNRASSGPMESVDPDRSDANRADDGSNAEMKQTIDRSRPPSSRRREKQHSLLAEIGLGILFGSVGVAFILFILIYVYPLE